MEIRTIIEWLQLLPHPEGGFYREVYRSLGNIPQQALGPQFSGSRNYSTSIYFLLTSENFSAFHRIKQDEIWHFYQGSAIRIHVIYPNGEYRPQDVGLDFEVGELPQFVVPAGCWFASSVKDADSFSLTGCTVSPGFDFADFELADRGELTATFPQHAQIIEQLTRI
ncbi:MAG: cupin domain-containing protein [Bacteroidia bacterium]